jgi:calcineurin-like phosphoesterase family protein
MKITLNKGQKLFFTSDTHYQHSNIVRGVSKWDGGLDKTRDYDTIDKMNSTIVNNINDVVGQEDILIHLGDWSFGGFDKIREFRNRLICQDIRLILGNHDYHIENNRENIQEIFTSVSQYEVLEVIAPTSHPIFGPNNKYEFVLCHYPIASWNNMNKGRMHLHGHVHLPKHQRMSGGKSIDIGMDGNNLKPYELREVVSLLKDKPVKTLSLPVDHHEQEVR